jgi:hypothetical protein
MPLLIIPWKETDCLWRLAALGYVKGLRHEEQFSVKLATSEPAPNWVKAQPVWGALAGVIPDSLVVLIHDADVWCPPAELDQAIAAVVSGKAQWSLPHRRVMRLDQGSTRRLCNGGTFEDNHLEQDPYDGIPGGGIVVARAGTLRETPLDPRFVGWGQEDESWGAALTTLHGEPWRGDAELIHLWHPPQERLTRSRGSIDNWLLKVCYCEAFGNPERMRALVDKGKLALETAQPRLHDSSPGAVE